MELKINFTKAEMFSYLLAKGYKPYPYEFRFCYDSSHCHIEDIKESVEKVDLYFQREYEFNEFVVNHPGDKPIFIRHKLPYHEFRFETVFMNEIKNKLLEL